MLKSIKPDQNNKVVCELQKTENYKRCEVKITGRATFACGKFSNKKFILFYWYNVYYQKMERYSFL